MNTRTRFLMVVAALLLISLALAACGGTPEPTAEATSEPTLEPEPAGDADNGAELFVGTCSSCHGAEATGIPGLGKDLTTSEWVGQQTDAQLVEFLATGRPATHELNTTGVDMPPKGGNPALTDQDLTDIVAYLRSINN
jgi:disulfide bond formation protein DsbB